MHVCIRCVLDERFPGIGFDETGECSFCRTYRARKTAPGETERKYEQRFLELVEAHRGRSGFDAVLAYSGGKDSTYTMVLLQQQFGMKVLALTMDNWFLADQALENIGALVKAGGVAHLTMRPQFETFRRVVRESTQGNLYSLKAMQRSSAVCTSCISMIRAWCLQTAIEKEIPFVIFGMSPGQAPLPTSIVKTNPEMIRQMQETVLRPLLDRAGDGIAPYFLSETHFGKAEQFPYIVNPLAFLPYDEEKIFRTISHLGWERPGDTDPNSTNCLLNTYANHHHKLRYGINPYAHEIAGLVRCGVISREEGIRRLAEEGNPALLLRVEKEIGS